MQARTQKTFYRKYARKLALSLTGLVCAAHFAMPLAASADGYQEACCNCEFEGNGNKGNICVNVPLGKGCDWAAQQAQDLSKGSYQLTCVFLEKEYCAKIGAKATGVCPNKPIIVTDFRSEYIEQFLGYGKKTADSAATKSKYITPKLEVPIPGVSFQDPMAYDNKIYISFLASYIAGFQKYLIGIAFIAAALMVIYGGFMYMVGSTGAKIQDAKERIKDALIGLVLVLGAYVLMSNINPQTVQPGLISLDIVKEDLFFPKENGYYQPGADMAADWSPGKYDPPQDKSPVTTPPVGLLDSGQVQDLYAEGKVIGTTPAQKMLSVCLPRSEQNATGIKDKTRDEQIKYAGGVLRVWIKEGLLSGGAVYVRTGGTSLIESCNTQACEHPTVCAAGTTDPTFFVAIDAYKKGVCKPITDAYQTSFSFKNGPQGTIGCGTAIRLYQDPTIFNQVAEKIDNITGNQGVFDEMCKTFAMNESAEIQQAMTLMGVPYGDASCKLGISGMKALREGAKNAKSYLQRAIDGMDSNCRKAILPEYNACFAKPAGEAGLFCGDCGSTLAQFASCVGINPNNELFMKPKGGGAVRTESASYDSSNLSPEQILEAMTENIKSGSPNLSAPGGGDPASFLAVVGDPSWSLQKNQQAWRDAMADVGGPQFGDLHFSNCHNYMYVGGVGLKTDTGKDIYWFEMGGGGAADSQIGGACTPDKNGKVNNKTCDAAQSTQGMVGRGHLNIGDSRVDYNGFRIRFNPDISAYAGTSCGTVRGMWPIYIYRLFKDKPGTPRCDPADPSKGTCPAGKACMPNHRCKRIEIGSTCWARESWRGPTTPINCPNQTVCRACTKQEMLEYGWFKRHAISGALTPNPEKLDSRTNVGLPCFLNIGILNKKPGDYQPEVKYCMPTKSDDVMFSENSIK